MGRKEERVMVPVPTYRQSPTVLPADLGELSREELVRLKLDADEDIGAIKQQLADARFQRRGPDEITKEDREWYGRASRALRHRKRDTSRVQTEMAKRRPKSKADSKAEFAADFVAAAHELVDRQLFDAICQRAKDIRTVRMLTPEPEPIPADPDSRRSRIRALLEAEPDRVFELQEIADAVGFDDPEAARKIVGSLVKQRHLESPGPDTYRATQTSTSTSHHSK